MELIPYSLSGLYYNYNRTDDTKIKNILEKIVIVKPERKNGKFLGYFPLRKKCIEKIKNKPRNVSLTFDAAETTSKPIKDLIPYMKMAYLVKSSSRFFLKPDFGEIADQIPFNILHSDNLKAISIEEIYETLPDTQGEHFIMNATLLTIKK